MSSPLRVATVRFNNYPIWGTRGRSSDLRFANASLLDRKWIRVTVAAHDRRVTLLTETPEGLAVWKKSMHAFNQSSSELIPILSENEQVNAIRLLKKLEKTFKSK